MMKLSDFNYHLPEKLIARYPLKQRSASGLLCMNKISGEIQHQHFTDIIEFLNPNDLLIFNNTKVIPARLYGQKTSGGKVEILVERMLDMTSDDQHQALCLLRASKAPRPGTEIIINHEIRLKIVGRQQDFFVIQFPGAILPLLEAHGEMPLPPYFARKPEEDDQDRYQTVYAKHAGAVAAPTAGLHFDDLLLAKLAAKNVAMEYVTLHVGAGTFQPVRVDNILEHDMHHEHIDISQSVCDAVNQTKQAGGRVIAVGTTSVRCLETAAGTGAIKPFQGDTNIFIYPGYEFKCVDAMITNFHLPESTLLMLISAFAGLEKIKHAYDVAIEKHYRFYSYGDAMFLYTHS